jgi:serine/threonine protein kinase
VIRHTPAADRPAATADSSEIDLLARQVGCDRGRLHRLAGATDQSVVAALVAAGVIDRVAARALRLTADGRFDERDLKSVLTPTAVRSRLDRLADDTLPDQPAECPTFGVGDCIGRYVVKGLLGRGGSGRVYLGIHPTLRTSVAVKVPYHPTDSLRAEAELLAAVAHPNVVRVWDYDEADGTPFLVLEYVGGESLAATVRRSGRLDPARVTRAAVHAARGLRAAHRAGVTHGDVTPGNLLTTPGGTVKVSDFGLARKRTARPTDGPTTVRGTWRYAAPEAFTGPADQRADIYSLGLTLYHLYTGVPAVTARGWADGLAAHHALTLDPLHWFVPGVSRERSDVVRRMTARDPDGRFAGYDELLAALRRCR